MREGGYLIYAEWPERLIYIDDRAELYGEELFREYRDMRGGDYRGRLRSLGDRGCHVPERLAPDRVLTKDGWTIRAVRRLLHGVWKTVGSLRSR